MASRAKSNERGTDGLSSPTDEVSRVELLLAIARVKRSLLSAKDIAELTGLLPAGSDLGSTWNRFPSLDSRYALQRGLLIEKHVKNSQALTETLEDSNQRRARAQICRICARILFLLRKEMDSSFMGCWFNVIQVHIIE